MAVIGGDITSITYNNPDVGSGTFYPVAGTDSTFNNGGFRNNDDKAGVDGGGRLIVVKTQQRWSFKGTVSWDMSTSVEMETITELETVSSETTWTINHSNGSIYSGVGVPVGDNDAMGNAATIELNIMGAGQLTKIA